MTTVNKEMQSIVNDISQIKKTLQVKKIIKIVI